MMKGGGNAVDASELPAVGPCEGRQRRRAIADPFLPGEVAVLREETEERGL